jgi:hypothetical protein
MALRTNHPSACHFPHLTLLLPLAHEFLAIHDPYTQYVHLLTPVFISPGFCLIWFSSHPVFVSPGFCLTLFLSRPVSISPSSHLARLSSHIYRNHGTLVAYLFLVTPSPPRNHGTLVAHPS